MAELVIIHLYGTSNNTLVKCTDATRTVQLFKTSRGLHVKAGRDKNSLKTAAKFFVELNNFLTEYKTTCVEIRNRNKGSGYDKHLTSAIKLLLRSLKTNYNVFRTIDDTPITHGWIKRQKQKTR